MTDRSEKLQYGFLWRDSEEVPSIIWLATTFLAKGEEVWELEQLGLFIKVLSGKQI